MATMRMAREGVVRVTVGVDTHKDAHVARAKDQLGRHLGDSTISTTPSRDRHLLSWEQSYGDVDAWAWMAPVPMGRGYAGSGLAPPHT